jgi:hypothetical protein
VSRLVQADFASTWNPPPSEAPEARLINASPGGSVRCDGPAESSCALSRGRSDPSEELEHAPGHQDGRVGVVRRQAGVGEQVLLAGVGEEFGLLDGFDE